MFHPYNLYPLYPPLSHLPTNTNTSLPVFALAGRLLAYVTTVPSARPGPEGLGNLVTAHSTQRPRPSSSSNEPSQAIQSLSLSDSTQGAILASAVEIGGGVARGVWAGIKMGAKAASQARNNRLARSAPTEVSGSLADIESEENADAESRSLEEEESNVNMGTDGRAEENTGGEWIKIVDLSPRARPAISSRKATHISDRSSLSPSALSEPKVIAHFRSPPSHSHASTSTDMPKSRGRVAIRSHSRPVALLSFNPLGTQLLVAPNDGRTQHVFAIHPAGIESFSSQEACGEAWHLYELRRGNTAANVIQVNWGKDGRWVGIETGRGTIRELDFVSETVADVRRLSHQSYWRSRFFDHACLDSTS
jgi:hypothetical protein